MKTGIRIKMASSCPHNQVQIPNVSKVLRKTVWQFLKQTKRAATPQPAMALRGVRPSDTETRVRTEARAGTFTAASGLTATTALSPEAPSR